MTDNASQSLLPVDHLATMSEERAQSLAATMQKTVLAVKQQRQQDQNMITALQASLAEKEVEMMRVRDAASTVRMESEQALRGMRGELALSRSENDELRRKLAVVSEHFETFQEQVSGLWNTIEQKHRDLVSVEDRVQAFYSLNDASQALNRPASPAPAPRMEEFRGLLTRFQTESLAPVTSSTY
jgi:chromosome segregation ATPase